jgi:hypothetical protein
MTEGMFAGPTKIWRIKKGTGGCDEFKIYYYSPLHWGASNGCLGSDAATPWGAVIRWYRWKKEYEKNPRKYVT